MLRYMQDLAVGRRNPNAQRPAPSGPRAARSSIRSVSPYPSTVILSTSGFVYEQLYYSSFRGMAESAEPGKHVGPRRAMGSGPNRVGWIEAAQSGAPERVGKHVYRRLATAGARRGGPATSARYLYTPAPAWPAPCGGRAE